MAFIGAYTAAIHSAAYICDSKLEDQFCRGRKVFPFLLAKFAAPFPPGSLVLFASCS